MVWSSYYERARKWDDITKIINLSKLSSFGPSAEVYDVAKDFSNEDARATFMNKALSAGVTFDSEQLSIIDSANFVLRDNTYVPAQPEPQERAASRDAEPRKKSGFLWGIATVFLGNRLGARMLDKEWKSTFERKKTDARDL